MMRTIRPEDVVSPAVAGPSFAIVDCPSIAFIPSLINHVAWNVSRPSTSSTHTNSNGNGKGSNDGVTSAVSPISCMVHLSPMVVITNALYQQWMRSFGSHVQHILVNHSVGPRDKPVYRASSLTMRKLHQYFPSIFPLPCDAPPLSTTSGWRPSLAALSSSSSSLHDRALSATSRAANEAAQRDRNDRKEKAREKWRTKQNGKSVEQKEAERARAIAHAAAARPKKKRSENTKQQKGNNKSIEEDASTTDDATVVIPPITTVSPSFEEPPATATVTVTAASKPGPKLTKAQRKRARKEEKKNGLTPSTTPIASSSITSIVTVAATMPPNIGRTSSVGGAPVVRLTKSERKEAKAKSAQKVSVIDTPPPSSSLGTEKSSSQSSLTPSSSLVRVQSSMMNMDTFRPQTDDGLPESCVAGELMMKFELVPINRMGIDRSDCTTPLHRDELEWALNNLAPPPPPPPSSSSSSSSSSGSNGGLSRSITAIIPPGVNPLVPVGPTPEEIAAAAAVSAVIRARLIEYKAEFDQSAAAIRLASETTTSTATGSHGHMLKPLAVRL
jgi:hypothetical protein